MDQTKIDAYTVEVGHGKGKLMWKAAVGPRHQGNPVLEFKTREQARCYIVDNVYTDKVRIRHPDGHLEPASFRDIVRY